MRIFVFTLVLALGAVPADAQDEPATVYLMVDYLNVTSGPHAELEAEVWQPFWQALIDLGYRQSWHWYQPWFAFDNSYNNVFVHAISDPNHIDIPDEVSAEAERMAFRESTRAEVAAKFDVEIEFVKSEIWEVSAGAGEPEGEWVSVAFMKVDQDSEAEYLAVEREIWQPLMSARAAVDGYNGWLISSLLAPYGSDLPYTFAAVNYYGSLKATFETGFPAGTWEAVHPNQESSALLERTMAARQMARVELWRRVAHLHAQ